MNNKEFVGELSRSLGYTNKDATQLVASLVDIMTQVLQEGNLISVEGFGRFEVRKRLERIIINPMTKQRLLVPPKLVLTFTPDSLLKDYPTNTSADE